MTRNVPRKLVWITLSNSAPSPADRRQRHDPGIVDHHVDGPEGFNRLSEQVRDLGRIPNVGFHGDRLAAIGRDVGNCRTASARLLA